MGKYYVFMSNMSAKQEEKKLVKRVKLIIPHYILTNFYGPDWQSVDFTKFVQLVVFAEIV